MDGIETDAEGYLTDLSQWSREVAVALAGDAGLTLGDDHWRLIEVVRDFYRETGVSPAMRPLVKLARERLGAEFGSSIALMQLFPGNPAKVVARVGGLPRPTNCL